jgi:hypothetical protein
MVRIMSCRFLKHLNLDAAQEILGKDRVIKPDQIVDLFGYCQSYDKLSINYLESQLITCAQENTNGTGNWYLFPAGEQALADIEYNEVIMSRHLPRLVFDYHYSSDETITIWTHHNPTPGFVLINWSIQLAGKSYLQQNRCIDQLTLSQERVDPVVIIQVFLALTYLFKKPTLNNFNCFTDIPLKYGNLLCLSVDRMGIMQMKNLHQCALAGAILQLKRKENF